MVTGCVHQDRASEAKIRLNNRKSFVCSTYQAKISHLQYDDLFLPEQREVWPKHADECWQI